MSSWGIKNFENDAALDWVFDFKGEESPDFIAASFQKITESEGTIGAEESKQALAAAEVVAALKNRPSSDFPRSLESSLLNIETSTSFLENMALKALQHIKHHSELQAYWDQEGELDRWNDIIDDLINRIRF